FLTEKSALKLVFSVLIRAAKRWRKVDYVRLPFLQEVWDLTEQRFYKDCLKVTLGYSTGPTRLNT
ncbi:MAG: hypothetical protein J7M03_06135, partial [Candidatus Desulfofervidaceae bacterium]|nr:hypothetical protein [Candidatus Desulfofervidaceae bacterium]